MSSFFTIAQSFSLNDMFSGANGVISNMNRYI